jgi:hypothetical protein
MNRPSQSGYRGALSRRAMLLSAGASVLVAACDMPVPGLSGPRVDPARPVAVALLVPGGGGNEDRDALARNLENAARLAIADLQGVQIDLRVYQTAGDPQRAGAMGRACCIRRRTDHSWPALCRFRAGRWPSRCSSGGERSELFQ